MPTLYQIVYTTGERSLPLEWSGVLMVVRALRSHYTTLDLPVRVEELSA